MSTQAPILDAIPAELRECAQWVRWRSETRSGVAKPTKMPYDCNGSHRARTNDPTTWGTFQQAVQAYTKHADTYAGIGFVFTADDDYCGIDLDECIGDDGELKPEARAIITRFESYAEISPSGRGVKIFIKGTLPPGCGHKRKAMNFKEIEVYDRLRYFTVTGRRLPETPASVNDAQEALDWFVKRYGFAQLPKPPPLPPTPKGKSSARSKRSIMERCRAYIKKMPDAVSSHGGHNATLAAACACFRFGLSDSDAIDIMREFNTSKTGGETWTDKELAHKLADAKKKVEAAGEFGCRLKEAKHEDGSQHVKVLTVNIAEHCTDIGNAARFVAQHQGSVIFSAGRAYVYDGTRYRVDDLEQVLALAKQTALSIFDEAKRAADTIKQSGLGKHALQTQRRERVMAMVALARPELSVLPEKLDADPWAFNCLNGTIDLQTGRLRPHRQADLITKLAPVQYDPNAQAPIWERVLQRTFKGDADLIAWVQRFEGMSLSADVREQVFPVYYGVGGNGKNVHLDTICGVMGDYACEAPPNLVTTAKRQEHPTEVADLLGRRFVVTSESEESAHLRLQLVKRLTGNVRIKARYMRQDYFEFPRTFKFVLVTNNKPVISEDGEAAWRRLRLVPFDVVIPPAERDAALLEKLRPEWPGILAWLVRGCLAWQEQGLGDPAAVREATAHYRSESDLFGAFINECCNANPTVWVPSQRLRQEYEKWSAEQGSELLVGSAFGERMRQRGFNPGRKQGMRVWMGLEMKP